MTREEFETMLDDHAFGFIGTSGIMAEYDRLTTINARLDMENRGLRWEVETLRPKAEQLTVEKADLLAALEEIEAAGRYSRTGTKAAYMGNVASAAIAKAKGEA